MVRDSCHALDRLHALFVRIEIPTFKVALRVKEDDVYKTTHFGLEPIWNLTCNVRNGHYPHIALLVFTNWRNVCGTTRRKVIALKSCE